MAKFKLQRMGELLKEELGNMILRSLDLKSGVLVTITKVETSDDVFHSDVWVSIYPFSEAEEVFEVLKKAESYLQHLLNKRLKSRPVPKIKFKIDLELEASSNVEEISRKIKKENE